MLKDMAISYIESELKYGEERKLYHFNCAETLLCACNDTYNLGLDNKVFKAIVPFGGGFYSEKACGALTGAIAALGIMFSEDKPTSNDKLKEITRRWVKVFEDEFGSTECKDIKKTHRDEVTGCGLVMIRAAELFEKEIRESQSI
ncbi:hypothetical protein GC105_03630 [Alkalibaculum sp. M08DMB]|uniref:C_GCAxxG_C_C family protein n=1 Tax=Alkalibaculum sporogenes TaxID=2655001 RepID=A0A6A7K629_9FIRM|nr:C-GCAxxG-C-C family protein [Alkalibaculum sporogenes]MPW24880.1 hypothetical protein [Alkalibaculum sporogenes]